MEGGGGGGHSPLPLRLVAEGRPPFPQVGSTRVCQTLKRNMPIFYNFEEEVMERTLPTHNQVLQDLYRENTEFYNLLWKFKVSYVFKRK